MSIATTQVTCTFFNQSGAAVPGAQVTARLDRTEIYQGMVVPKEVSAVADVNGIALLQLWPNALGVNGSRYRVTAVDPSTGLRFLDWNVSVPETDCLLHNIFSQAPYPPIDASAQALAVAQGALALVIEQASIATLKAGESAASASQSSASEVAAAAAALAAATKAAEASASAASTTAQSSSATSSAAAANLALLALGNVLANGIGAVTVDGAGDLNIAYNTPTVTSMAIDGSGNLNVTYP